MSIPSEPSSTVERSGPPAAGSAVVWLGTVTDSSELSDARRAASAALSEAGCGEDVTDNVTLALSELAVNALTHGAAASVEVTVSLATSSVVLTVRHLDRGTPALLDPPTMAGPDQLHGRGRAIVASISDRFDTFRRPGDEIEHVVRFDVHDAPGSAQPVAPPVRKPAGWSRPTTRAWSPDAVHVLVKPTGAICNLGCAYCFFLDKELLYEGDRFRMSDEVLERYIVQLIEAHRAPQVTIAWQGGEPTLMGVDFYRRAVEIAERHRRPGMTFLHTMQTNGTLLDDEWCTFFREHDFLIGISIDGPRELHDAYRVDKRGNGTFDKVMRGLRLLQHHGVEYNVLTTVNRVNADHPLEVYRFLRDDVGTAWMQFIPVVERVDADGQPADLRGAHVSDRTVRPDQFGRFLTTIFDEWVHHDVGEVYVQTFEAAARNWAGLGNSGMCVFNETCGTGVALEHNGDLYSCDHFVDPDFFMGNIADATIDELVAAPAQHEFGMAKRDTLPRYCLDCDVRFACQGECPKNRFVETPDGEHGLNYLCEGYKTFFHHVDRPMRTMIDLMRSGQYASDVMDVLADERRAFERAVAAAGRNGPCPCGSGKKVKRCHGGRDPADDAEPARELPDVPAGSPRPRVRRSAQLPTSDTQEPTTVATPASSPPSS